MKKILYVVHRYAPYPGGSENYVRDLAEETLSRGHQVTVLAGEHKGNLNGVIVTSDPRIVAENWDLIVVHGGDVSVQNWVLSNAPRIPSPILYLLILPSHSAVCVKALHEVTFIGCSTPADWRHCQSWDVSHKAVGVTHSIHGEKSVGYPGFREKYGITTKYMFLSCGGFWPNKAFGELVDLFKKADRQDTTLVLTGYDNRHGIMPPNEYNIQSVLLDDRQEVLNAIREADLYIMHSLSEGFGLVLLEAMWNYTPWAARHMAGAELMKEYGFTYSRDGELVEYMRGFIPGKDTKDAQAYVKGAHLIKNSVDDILKVIR